MSAKVVVKCDGRSCFNEREFEFGCFNEGDLPGINWSYDADNAFYYCPSCVKRMISNGEWIEKIY